MNATITTKELKHFIIVIAWLFIFKSFAEMFSKYHFCLSVCHWFLYVYIRHSKFRSVSSNLYLWYTLNLSSLDYLRANLCSRRSGSNTGTRNTTFGTWRTSDGNHHGRSRAEIYGFCLVPSFLAGPRFDLRSNCGAISETRRRAHRRRTKGRTDVERERERGRNEKTEKGSWCAITLTVSHFDLTVSPLSFFSSSLLFSFSFSFSLYSRDHTLPHSSIFRRASSATDTLRRHVASPASIYH